MKTLTKYSYREIWQIAYPILISLVVENMIGLTDTAFLGRVGEVELGASALAGVYYVAIFMMAFGFGIGSQILIARRNGERRYREIGLIFYQGLYFLTLLAAVLFGLSYLFSASLLEKIIESPAVCEATVSYMNWRVCGFFFSFAGVMFRAFYVGTTHTKTLTWNSVVMVLSNVFFNWVLIFGHFGLPALGIAGAAIGSSLAEMVSVIFFVIYTWRRVDLRKYGLNCLCGFRGSVLRRILSVSIWTMIQNFISLSVWFLFFIAVEHLGERPLAVSNIVRSLSAFPFVMVSSFAATCSSLVSNLIGAGEVRYVWGTIWQCIRLSALCTGSVLLIFVLFPQVVLRIYTDSPELIQASIPSLMVLVSSYILSLPGFILFQTVSGTGNTRSALGMELVALGIYSVFVYWVIICLRPDVMYGWFSEHVYAICILSFSYLYLKRGHWQNRKI